MPAQPIQRHGLEIDATFATFIEDEVLPGTGVDADRFWSGYAGLLADFADENSAYLKVRE